MLRSILMAALFFISFASTGVAKDSGLVGGQMADPSDPIPRAPIGHRQSTPRYLVTSKPALEGTVGVNPRSSGADAQIDATDRQIIEENKEVDRMISGICRGC